MAAPSKNPTRVPPPTGGRPREPRQRRPGRRRRGAPALVLGVAAIAVAAVFGHGVLSGGGGGADSPSGVHDPWRDLAHDIAARWPGLQTRVGWYRDYVYGGGRDFCFARVCRANLGNARYGESLLGYGLIMTGVRENDERLVDSGVRALSYVVRFPRLQRQFATAFEGLAVAGAYNLLRVRLPINPRFTRARRSWERFLRRQPPTSTIFRVPQTTRYGNHFLVEAIEVLEMLKTRLRSSDPRAILGPRRRSWKRVVKLLLNQRVPQRAAVGALRVKGRRAWIHSDPPDNPLAYFGLASGLYARALQLLGDDARRASRRPVRDAANASVQLMAPDGDLAYSGRSQEASWAYSAIALADEFAAAYATPSRGCKRTTAPSARTRSSASAATTAMGPPAGGSCLACAARGSPTTGLTAIPARSPSPG